MFSHVNGLLTLLSHYHARHIYKIDSGDDDDNDDYNHHSIINALVMTNHPINSG